MAPPKITPKTPGNPEPTGPTDLDVAAAEERLSNEPLTADTSAPEQKLQLTPSELSAMVAAEVAKAMANQPKMVVPTATPKAPANLPTVEAVMASKPDKPVLSREGWVVPSTYGATPGASKL